VVWLPVPCAEETPDPELLDDTELPAAEVPPDDPLEPPPAEDELPVAAAAPVVCAEPGRAKAIKPAPATPAAPTAAVTARSRACPRRLAATANRPSGSAEFIGFPSWFSPQSGCRVWGSPVKRLCPSSELRPANAQRLRAERRLLVMKRTLRMAGPAAIAGLVAAIGVAGCGSTVASLARAGPPSPSISPVSERGAVPWVDQPGQFFQPSPLPAHYRPTSAPPCTAAQLQVSPQGPNGAGGHLFFYFDFRNVSGTTCILPGYPHAVASEPGKPDVTATHSGWFADIERSGNMRPGGVTWLSIETDFNCRARYAHPNEHPTRVYHTVTVSIPGGGQVVINGTFDVLCGLFTGRFAVRQPPQRYTQSPITGARVTLDLPSGVVAGTTLDYVAALTNPTGTDMVLHPCPGYQQSLGPAGKAVLSLNCRAQRTIPAHQTVRFAMRLHVPADTPTGPGNLVWSIAAPAGIFAHGSLHVYGRDTPCRASQLHASVTGPGQFPGPPNVMGIKKLATEVPLTVTNVSGRACSVYGVPAVAVRAADGSGLGLRQIPDSNFSMRPVPQPQTAITLTPHKGTARTTLYWYLSWCGPDPNPVRVTITFPADGAKITVIPTGGWVPALCRGVSAGPHVNPRKVNPGWVSADAFQPG
jgi:hypothetical protein